MNPPIRPIRAWAGRCAFVAVLLALCLGSTAGASEAAPASAGSSVPHQTELADEPGRSADNRGLILVGSVVLVLVMTLGAALVARDEAGRRTGRPGDDRTAPRPGEAEGRHTARSTDEAWPHRR